MKSSCQQCLAGLEVPGLSQTGVNLFDVMVAKPHYQPPLTPPPEEDERGRDNAGGTKVDGGASNLESIGASVKGEEDAVFYRTLQQIQKVSNQLTLFWLDGGLIKNKTGHSTGYRKTALPYNETIVCRPVLPCVWDVQND